MPHGARGVVERDSPTEPKGGRFYYPFVHELGPGTWGAWVYDHAAATWVPMGTLSLPAAWGKLSPDSTTTVGWFGPTASTCAALPRAEVWFHAPDGVAGSTTTAASLVTTAADPGDCAAQTSTEPGGWARYRVGSG